MIDYDKLKIAHELAEKYANTYNEFCSVSVDFYCLNDPINYALRCLNFIVFSAENIDDLITRLKEMNESHKPKPKYEVGQKVWYFYEDEIRHDIVELIEYHEDCFIYTLVFGFFYEEFLFPSRETLIEYQIEYWNNLKHEFSRITSSCEHESECKRCGMKYNFL
jgi:hypothetical protein